MYSGSDCIKRVIVQKSAFPGFIMSAKLYYLLVLSLHMPYAGLSINCCYFEELLQ